MWSLDNLRFGLVVKCCFPLTYLRHHAFPYKFIHMFHFCHYISKEFRDNIIFVKIFIYKQFVFKTNVHVKLLVVCIYFPNTFCRYSNKLYLICFMIIKRSLSFVIWYHFVFLLSLHGHLTIFGWQYKMKWLRFRTL